MSGGKIIPIIAAGDQAVRDNAQALVVPIQHDVEVMQTDIEYLKHTIPGLQFTNEQALREFALQQERMRAMLDESRRNAAVNHQIQATAIAPPDQSDSPPCARASTTSPPRLASYSGWCRAWPGASTTRHRERRPDDRPLAGSAQDPARAPGERAPGRPVGARHRDRRHARPARYLEDQVATIAATVARIDQVIDRLEKELA